MTTLWIVIAGAAGCVVRWLIESVTARRNENYRAFATMGVNALGTAVVGYVIYVATHSTWSLAHQEDFARHGEAILLTGFCGGFTTFSSALAFPYLDWQRGARMRAGILLGATPLLCVAGMLLGEAAAKI